MFVAHDDVVISKYFMLTILSSGKQLVMRFECLGVEKDVIATLCSLFTSLDKDGG